MTKKCHKCLNHLELNEFQKNKRNKDGYSTNCKKCANLASKKRRDANIENARAKRKIYYDKNILKIREQTRLARKKAVHKKSEYDKEYRGKKQKEIAEFKRKWAIKKREESPLFRIKNNLRRRIHHALNGKNKSKRTIELIGCTIDFFIKYIESKFTEGMSWNNYGTKGWHIDHIIPCAKFDLSIPEEQQKCFHYSNQQPLWATDNYKKGRK